MEETLLSGFDLNAKEIAAYQAIVKLGSISPAVLAKAIGVKRPTAYHVGRALVEKGLLSEDQTRRPRVFTLASAKEILSLIDTDKRRLHEREISLKKLANELSTSSAKKSYPVPTVRFIEAEKIPSFLRQQSPIWNKSLIARSECWWGFRDHTFVENFGEWLDWYWGHAPSHMQVKLLTNHAPAEISLGEKHASRKREIKYWGEALDFQSSTWVAGDYLIIVNTRKQPFYLVEIHDTLLAHDQREVFRNLWKMI
jgi:DNA-binding MarR family transcriptional regulator